MLKPWNSLNMKAYACLLLVFLIHQCQSQSKKMRRLENKIKHLEDNFEKELKNLRDDLDWERAKTKRLLELNDRSELAFSDDIEQKIANLTDTVDSLQECGCQTIDDRKIAQEIKGLDLSTNVLETAVGDQKRQFKEFAVNIKKMVSNTMDTIKKAHFEEISTLKTQMEEMNNGMKELSEEIRNVTELVEILPKSKHSRSKCVDCGCTFPWRTNYTDRTPRVASATKNAWPWMAQLKRKIRSRNRHLCGASIIDKNWILTAAQCVAAGFGDLIVDIGRSNLSDNDDVISRSVEENQMFVHERFNRKETTTYLYDVALIFLKDEISFGDDIHAVCLPEQGDSNRFSHHGTFGVVTGWGAIKGHFRTTNHMKQLQMVIKSDDTCIDMHNDAPKQFNSSLMFCAGGLDDGEIVDTCAGDSGNPFVVPYPDDMEGKTDHFVQIGISSWGFGRCNTRGLYGVYTKLSPEILQWIQEKMATKI